MKKVFGWYNFLLDKGMVEFTEETSADAVENAAEEVSEEKAVSKEDKEGKADS